MRKKLVLQAGMALYCTFSVLTTSDMVFGEESTKVSCENAESAMEDKTYLKDLSQFNYEEDVQYMIMREAGEQPAARCEDGYYIRIEDIICFADTELENVIPLCHNIDCVHQADTKLERVECSAYAGETPMAPSISYANGKLYVSSTFDFTNRDEKLLIKR